MIEIPENAITNTNREGIIDKDYALYQTDRAIIKEIYEKNNFDKKLDKIDLSQFKDIDPHDYYQLEIAELAKYYIVGAEITQVQNDNRPIDFYLKEEPVFYTYPTSTFKADYYLKEWWPNGVIHKSLEHQPKSQNKLIEYHPNGKIHRERFYNYGLINAFEKVYDEDGKFIKQNKFGVIDNKIYQIDDNDNKSDGITRILFSIGSLVLVGTTITYGFIKLVQFLR